MRVIAACVVALGLAALPAMAGTGGAGTPTASGSAETAPASSNSTPSASSDPAAKPEPSSADMENQLQELRDLIEIQSKQIQQQSEALKAQQAQTEALERQLATAGHVDLSASASPAAPVSGSPAATVSATPQPSAVVSNTALTPSGNAAAQDKNSTPPADEPTSLHYKGITLTPGGFMAAESVWRQHALSADINTPFTSVPFPGSSQDKVSEFNASGRQSRISMLVEGKLPSVKIGGYYETDFLGTGITSNNNQSNSYVLRQRQFWGQAAFNSGWTITGGQMWSLATETRSGVSNRTEATPATIDAQYQVGFTWSRQYGLRFSKSFENKFWLAGSVEQAQTLLTAHGNNNNFLVGQYGVGGGLYNATANYAYNEIPDFVVKAVAEPGFGHYEIFGIVRTFRDRIFPCVTVATSLSGCSGSATSPFGAYNDSRVGGGIGANARATFFKKVELGIHFLGGDGIGKYGTSSLADATVRPDGTLALIRNYQGLASVELHPTSKLDVYLYTGGEYDARAAYTIGSKGEGYGSPLFVNSGCWAETDPGTATSTPNGVGGSAGFIPGSLSNCTGDTRNIWEGTLGFWYRFYRGSKGTMQYGMQYSYVEKNTWSGVGTTSGTGVTGQPSANDNMIFTSLRYYLP